MDANRQALIDTIYDHGYVERTAIGRFVFLQKSDLLTEDERAWVVKVVDEEVAHAKATEELAKRLGPRASEPIPQVETAMEEYRCQVHGALPEEMLVYIYVAERLALRVFRHLESQLRAAGMDEAADHYLWIIGDEKEHARVGGKIMWRLIRETDLGHRLRALYRKAVREHYRGKPYSESHQEIAA